MLLFGSLNVLGFCGLPTVSQDPLVASLADSLELSAFLGKVTGLDLFFR